MWIWLGSILILLLLALFVLICLSPFKFHIEARKLNGDENFRIEFIFLYGLIRKRYDIPKARIGNLKMAINVQDSDRAQDALSSNKKGSQTEEGSKGTGKTSPGLSKTFKELYRSVENFKQLCLALLRQVHITRLEWSTNIALGDAAHTATLSGALWGLKSTLVGFFSCFIQLRKSPSLFIVPVFDKPPFFLTELKMSGQIRIGRLLLKGIVLLVPILKVTVGKKKRR